MEGLREKPVAFSRAILGRPAYWERQQEIARSVVRHHATLVPTGNMVGKTYLAAGLIHWFLFTRPNSIVLATAPSQTQLSEVLWSSVEEAYHGARVPLGGRALKSPLKIELTPGWHALAYSTTKVERLSGHHAGELFVVVDEASGVDDAIFEALRSCGPSREILIGNPLRPDGTFYERCQSAKDNPLAHVIHIDSREGPHAELDRSPWGLADKTWLATVRNDYGEGSLWWKCHVLGVFPDDAFDAVFYREWLDLAFRTIHKPHGPNRLAIDLGLGNGGDQTVLIAVDANGVLTCEASNQWTLEQAAQRAKILADRFQIEPYRITFDIEGIGADFSNRLDSVGLKGCQPYRGGGGGTKKYFNLRTGAAWRCRQRLDPNYQTMTAPGVFIPQVPFSMMKMPERSKQLLRRELQELRYELKTSQTALEDAESYKKRLKRSPDHQACFCQLWAFMN